MFVYGQDSGQGYKHHDNENVASFASGQLVVFSADLMIRYRKTRAPQQDSSMTIRACRRDSRPLHREESEHKNLEP